MYNDLDITEEELEELLVNDCESQPGIEPFEVPTDPSSLDMLSEDLGDMYWR